MKRPAWPERKPDTRYTKTNSSKVKKKKMTKKNSVGKKFEKK